MNAIIRDQVQVINTGMSIGITFKLIPGKACEEAIDQPVNNSENGENVVYLEKIIEIVKEFEKAGWDVHEQEMSGNRYLVCAKYALDRPDHKLIDKAREIIDTYGPHDFDREYIPH